MAATHLDLEALEAGLDEIKRSPASEGVVELIVRRPAEGEREVLDEGLLTAAGLDGDRHTHYDAAVPGRELTLMNARLISLIAGDRERWPLAGDQLYVDLDLSTDNLPPGTRLELGSAVIEVTTQLHTGCSKFTERFGSAAIRFVNGKPGRALRLRGMYASVVQPGTVRSGDAILVRRPGTR